MTIQTNRHDQPLGGVLLQSHDVQTLSISELLIDNTLQVRHKLDEGAIKRYQNAYKAGTPMPPIKVAVVNGAVLILVDGWHRITALQRLGRGQVEAITIPCANLNEAGWIAAEANLQHGVMLKNSELRNVFRAYIKAGKHRKPGGKLKSWREIGTDLGKPHQTIAAWMVKDFPKLHRQYTSEHLSRPIGEGRKAPLRETAKDVCERFLDNAAAALKGVTNRDDRVELAAKLQEMRDALTDVSQAQVEIYRQEDF